jgi:hypothetical protein
VLISCWSAKGGSGTTVVSVALALLLARSAPSGALLVDLAGDVPAALGLPEPDGPGVLDWLAAGSDTPADALARLEREAADGLTVVPTGSARPAWSPACGGAAARDPWDHGPPGPDPVGAGAAAGAGAGVGAGGGWPSGAAAGASTARSADGVRPGGPTARPAVLVDRADLLAGVLAADPRPVVADCGTLRPGDAGAAVTVAASASVSLLVVRPCFLALRRSAAAPLRPSGVVVVAEPGRALGRREVEDVLRVPVRAEVPWDPAVARAVDAGLVAARLPRTLARSLRGAA